MDCITERYRRNCKYETVADPLKCTDVHSCFLWDVRTCTGTRVKNNRAHLCSVHPKTNIINSKYIHLMNKSQIRFCRTLAATWKVLQDPVLTNIYVRKWKRQRDMQVTIYGYVFREMYKAAWWVVFLFFFGILSRKGTISLRNSFGLPSVFLRKE